MDRFARPDPPAQDDAPPRLGALEAAWRFGGSEQLLVRLAMVGKLIDRYLTRRLAAECGLNVAQWRVLTLLRYNGVSTLRDLAVQAWVDRGDVSRALAALEKRGLAERQPDPLDRRSPRFLITPAGLDLHCRFDDAWHEFRSTFNGSVSPDDVPLVERSLEAFAVTCLDLLGER